MLYIPLDLSLQTAFKNQLIYCRKLPPWRICEKELFLGVQLKQFVLNGKKKSLFKVSNIWHYLKIELCICCLQRNVFAQLQITNIKAPRSRVATKNNSLPAFFFLCLCGFSSYVLLCFLSLFWSFHPNQVWSGKHLKSWGYCYEVNY